MGDWLPVVGIDFSMNESKERKTIITHTARPDPEGSSKSEKP
jgi:hypothetical protein